jgi:DNA-binding MarR family transcriptional regulator
MSQPVYELGEAVARFVRAFGLHQPDRTPCGTPIPVSEAHALGELAHEGELRQVELVRRLKLEKSTTSRIISQLVTRGWVERVPSPDDGRGVLVRMTPEGRKAAGQLAQARRARFESAIRRIPPAERQTVLRALSLLTEAVDDR